MGLDGQTGHLMSTGMLVFTLVVIISNLKMLVFTKSHYNFTLFFIFGSIAFYVMSYYVFNLFSSLDSYNTFDPLHETPYYYLLILEVIAFTYVTDLMINRFIGKFYSLIRN